MESLIAFVQTTDVVPEVQKEAASGGVWESIANSLTKTFTEMGESAVSLIPRFVAMVAILIVGLLIAKLLRGVASTVLTKIQFDSICDKTGLHEVTRSLGMTQPLSTVASQLAFYGAMLMFLVAAVDVLGMESVSNAVGSLVAFLPNVIAALVIMIAGVMAGNFARKIAQGTAERMGFDYAPAIGSLTFGAIVFLVGNVAITQLQIDIQLVNRIVEIGLMACGLALAIAVGLGTKEIARHVIAGIYARDSFQPGTVINFGEHRGEVEAVRAINTTIKTEDGNVVYIPNFNLTETEVVQTDTET